MASAPDSQRPEPARARRAAADRPQVPVVEFRDVTKVYDGGSVGLERASMTDRPRRVRLPRRPDRLRQVHLHPPAA